MEETKLHSYRGNCHCGRFVFEVRLPEIKGYNDCNCSICTMKGYAWVIPQDNDHFQFVKGSMDELKGYNFNSGNFTHRFCSDCGTAVLGELPVVTPSLYINARAIQGLDIWSFGAKTFGGKDLPPSYEASVYDGPEPTAVVENGKIYHGSCHCGAVKLAIKMKPLETWDTLSDGEERVVECNCSICVRGAYVWCYLHKDQSVVQGRENLSYRVFNTNQNRKGFCKHCGVHMFNESNPLTDAQVAALTDNAKAWHEPNNRNINLRILHDFDFRTLKTQKLDGAGKIPGSYVDP